MCGIVVHAKTAGCHASREELTGALDTLSHRGPDGQRVEVHENIGLAHCRLAVLDLSDRGLQPMVHEPSGWRILYNGEIYNFRVLRKQLKKKGYTFDTETDTEVLLKGWVEWKKVLFSKVNGMYAVVFVHPPSNRITAMRDEFGIKPLYWRQDEAGLYLASEQKAILQLMTGRGELDLEGLNEYLTFQNFLSDRTLLKEIRTLDPGVLYEFDSGAPREEPMRQTLMRIQFQNRFGGSREEAKEELRTRLEKAVETHLVSDVPVHAYLSGGMDTSTISVLADTRSSDPLKTFTIGFDTEGIDGKEKAYDERPAARRVAEAIQSEHFEEEVTAHTLEEVMDDLVWHLEEPRVGQSYPNMKAAELAAEHGKAVLSGTGGDELFGGYPWRYQIAWCGEREEENINGYYRYWNRLFDREERKDLIRDEFHPEIDFDRPRRLFKNWLGSLPYRTGTKEGFLQAGFHIDMEFFLRGLLHVEDKLGMAHGIETRFPFLDRNLVQFSASLPASWKVDPFYGDQQVGEYRKGNNGKRILREVMEAMLPRRIKRRDKQGFSGPYAEWQQNEQHAWIQSRLKGITGALNLDNRAFMKQKFGENRLIPWSLLYVQTFERDVVMR